MEPISNGTHTPLPILGVNIPEISVITQYFIILIWMFNVNLKIFWDHKYRYHTDIGKSRVHWNAKYIDWC